MTRHAYTLPVRAAWLLLILALLSSACSTASAPPAAAPDPSACVDGYDPDVAYFPDQARLTHAEGWTIEYFNHYKVISVRTPWQGAEEPVQYVLVQCGTPAPEGFPNAQMIEVPVRSIVTMSTTYLPHLETLGLVDQLVGVDDPQFAYASAVVARIAAGEVATIGSGADVNIERVLALDPDLVMTFATGSPQGDAHPQLLAAGLPVALNAEYLEPTPLGQAEWIKFTAAFFNQEATAEEAFAAVASEYAALAELAQETSERPTVLMNAPFQGTWHVAGGNSNLAQMLADAGADYLWADNPTAGSLPLSFEAVFDQAANADVWVHPGSATTMDDLLATDERFSNFAAVQSGAVYNNNRRTNAQGGNDYWESGTSNPHLILADLIAVLHPDLLPDHELYYYQQVR